jgi:hypothetical protein
VVDYDRVATGFKVSEFRSDVMIDSGATAHAGRQLRPKWVIHVAGLMLLGRVGLKPAMEHDQGREHPSED